MGLDRAWKPIESRRVYTYRHPIRSARQEFRFDAFTLNGSARDRGNVPARAVAHRSEVVGVFFGEVDAHGEAFLELRRSHGVWAIVRQVELFFFFLGVGEGAVDDFRFRPSLMRCGDSKCECTVRL